MKKILALLCLAALLLAGCGNVRNVTIPEVPSEIYTQREISAAISAAKGYFARHFTGCTLEEISYAGDEVNQKEQREGMGDILVLTSRFTTDGNGGDGSFNPNDTYTKFKWFLVRDGLGRWKHFDHGYG